MEDQVAAMDQLVRGMKDFARATWAFYSEHVAAGFSEAQAMDLTHAWIVQMAANQKDGE